MINRSKFHIKFSVSGKAGETKSVAHTPSEDGVLRYFSAEHIEATDTSFSPGKGTTVLKARSGDHWPITWEGQETSRYSSHISFETCCMNSCHPKLPITFTIKFLEDCTWSAVVIGSAAVVANEGKFAEIPTVPCTNVVPMKYQALTGNHSFYEAHDFYWHARTICEHCWFEYQEHASWPKGVMDSWPADQLKQYNAGTDPCDMWNGPCCCGAWHKNGR